MRDGRSDPGNHTRAITAVCPLEPSMARQQEVRNMEGEEALPAQLVQHPKKHPTITGKV